MKKQRKKRKLTQQELADLINVNLRTIVKWENGYSKPKASYMIRLKRAYNIPLRPIKTPEEREKLKQKRRQVLNEIDRKTDSWKTLDDNDPLMLKLRTVYNVKGGHVK